MLENIWGYIIVMVLAIAFHEIGHLAALSHYNPDKQIKLHFSKLKISVGDWEENYAHLTKKQLFDVYLWGVLGGLIPILIYTWDHPTLHPYYGYALFIVYLAGCAVDFKSMRGVLR